MEQSLKQKAERLASPPDSSLEDCNDGSDSPRITSPLLQPLVTANKPIRPMTLKVTRQKRLTCHPNDKTWHAREKGLIHGDINSD